MRQRISAIDLARHLAFLCDTIGERLAGHAGERRAATYIADELQACGATVSTETFPVRARRVASQELQIRIGGKWESFPCSLFSSTPGTNGEWVEAPLTVLESPAVTEGDDLSHLRGKAVVHLGCHIESRQAYRRLIAADPAFLLFVDIRYPADVPLADGMFPAYVNALGAVPTVNVAYQHAWRWQEAFADRARLCVVGGMEPAESQNVIALLSGTDPGDDTIYLGAHHDTQADSPGADDNASGVAGLIALAQALAAHPHRRHIRLISFGAEEQLSEGSAAYVRRHRREFAGGHRFMFNLDSYGSHLGWNELHCLGQPTMSRWLRRFFADTPVRIHREVLPYVDAFPFAAAGIPAVTLMRPNCTGGRFFHHRPDDNLSRVSPNGMASRLENVYRCVESLATCESWPFDDPFPCDLKTAVETCWQDLFGGWGDRQDNCPAMK